MIVLDAPTLIESGLSQDCHKTIGVLAPVQVRLKRIIQRDGLTEEQALCVFMHNRRIPFICHNAMSFLDGCSASAELDEQIADIVRKAG